jgi:hypothetical protein
MLHQHGVQRAARATDRSQARRPRISPSFLARSGDVLDHAVSWRELKGRSPGLSVDLPRGPYRRRWSGPEAAGLLPNAAAKFGVGASSVSRALAKQDDEAPLRNGGLCRL